MHLLNLTIPRTVLRLSLMAPKAGVAHFSCPPSWLSMEPKYYSPFLVLKFNKGNFSYYSSWLSIQGIPAV